MTDALSGELSEERRQERLRKEENIAWLEEHMGFRPFGAEW